MVSTSGRSNPSWRCGQRAVSEAAFGGITHGYITELHGQLHRVGSAFSTILPTYAFFDLGCGARPAA